jgi:hypothetical protein
VSNHKITPVINLRGWHTRKDATIIFVSKSKAKIRLFRYLLTRHVITHQLRVLLKITSKTRVIFNEIKQREIILECEQVETVRMARQTQTTCSCLHLCSMYISLLHHLSKWGTGWYVRHLNVCCAAYNSGYDTQLYDTPHCMQGCVTASYTLC